MAGIDDKVASVDDMAMGIDASVVSVGDKVAGVIHSVRIVFSQA